jgi:hypothetical protein
MDNPSTPAGSDNLLLAALEASSGALRAVEAAVALNPPTDEDSARKLARTLALLRETISELRSVQLSGPGIGEGGFVLPDCS